MTVEGESRPYKGPESYESEDGDLFFGRSREADKLLSVILSSRTTLLHAQSGAGKTSLLNAVVIPNLDARGWQPIRSRPEHDPMAAIRSATLQAAVLHPELELRALERARDALAPGRDDLTLGELLKLYDEVPVRDARRRELQAAMASRLSSGGFSLGLDAKVTPFFARLLRQSLTVDRYAEHILVEEGASDDPSLYITAGTKLGDLAKLLGSREVVDAHDDLLADLAAPFPGLAPFFQNFWEVYSSRGLAPTLVLILDQFEEMFTRFVDPGVGRERNRVDLPDHHLRWRFFEEFQQLYLARSPAEHLGQVESDRGEEEDLELPIRFVFSMREEYIGQLGPVREVVRDLDDCAFRLALLEVDDALAAIEEPSSLFGYSYSSECSDDILDSLAKEKRRLEGGKLEGLVEPSHLQIVCEKLWQEFGRKYATERSDAEHAGELAEIGYAEFLRLGGEGAGRGDVVPRILKDFFAEFLAELSPAERSEALDLLGPLITNTRTRNIVERTALIGAVYQDTDLRARLLAELENGRIVRVEPRLGGHFVEITHEFLIPAILDEIREHHAADDDDAQLRAAFRALSLYVDVEPDGRLLPGKAEFDSIHRSRDSIKWTLPLVQIMLRAAIVLGVEGEILRDWFDRFEAAQGGVDRLAEALARLRAKDDDTMPFRIEDWRVISEHRDNLALSESERLILLGSALRFATDPQRDDVAAWAGRFLEDVG